MLLMMMNFPLLEANMLFIPLVTKRSFGFLKVRNIRLAENSQLGPGIHCPSPKATDKIGEGGGGGSSTGYFGASHHDSRDFGITQKTVGQKGVKVYSFGKLRALAFCKNQNHHHRCHR